jgi:hypothetical protein
MTDLIKRMSNYSDSLAPPIAKNLISDAVTALEAANARAGALEALCDRRFDEIAELHARIAELEAITQAPRGTNEQILMERKLTCEQIDGAMAFGYQNTNPPPSDDHWLAPFWKIGRQQADLESQLTAKTELATLYAASLRKVEGDGEGKLSREQIEKIAGGCMESGRYWLFMGQINDAIAASAKGQ